MIAFSLPLNRDRFRPETEVRWILDYAPFLVFETTITFKLRSQDTRAFVSNWISFPLRGKGNGRRGGGGVGGEITGEIKGEIGYEKLGLSETSENLTSGRPAVVHYGEFCNCEKKGRKKTGISG